MCATVLLCDDLLFYVNPPHKYEEEYAMWFCLRAVTLDNLCCAVMSGAGGACGEVHPYIIYYIVYTVTLAYA